MHADPLPHFLLQVKHPVLYFVRDFSSQQVLAGFLWAASARDPPSLPHSLTARTRIFRPHLP